MNRIISSIAAASLSGLLFSTPAFSDERELIEMPPEVQVKFLAEMRGLLESVNEMLLALSEGDFDTVSKIADINMGFKHNKWKKMVDDGVSEDEVQAKINAMREKLANHKPNAEKMKKSKGMSRFMPDNARAMGRQMHLSASQVSLAAQSAGENPDVEKYKEVLEGIQGITTMCASCHTGYKIR